jgi:hypothetical protein
MQVINKPLGVLQLSRIRTNRIRYPKYFLHVGLSLGLWAVIVFAVMRAL